jgi:hypothetical protein
MAKNPLFECKEIARESKKNLPLGARFFRPLLDARQDFLSRPDKIHEAGRWLRRTRTQFVHSLFTTGYRP